MNFRTLGLGLGAICLVVLVRCGPAAPVFANHGVAGAADTHCTADDGGVTVQETTAAACHPDAGVGDGGMVDYGPTLFGGEGDDDDCKYHLVWQSTPLAQNSDVTFQVKLTTTADKAPVASAQTLAEVFLTDTHAAPNSGQATKEASGGVYTVGPVRFDASGRWTVRFHFFEDCSDLREDSPHGHAAFFVDVP